jgi:large subunit ribosomal protein L24
VRQLIAEYDEPLTSTDSPKTRHPLFRSYDRSSSVSGTPCKMQKILRRVATAERVVAKRKTNRDWLAWKKAHYAELDDVRFQRSTLAEELGQAKQAIKDDWHLGPLSPNLSVGEHSSTHGAISEARYQVATSLTDRQREARCAWMGGAANLNITNGDRVVLLEGPDKGKIGKVQEVQKDTMEVIVEGLNKVRRPGCPPHCARHI